MSQTRSTRTFSRRGVSIEHKLPLAVCAVLTLLLAIYIWLAYHEVSRSATDAVGKRDALLATDLARLSGGTALARSSVVYRTANRDLVYRALTSDRPDVADTLIARLRQPNDTVFTVVLLDSLRRPIHFIGDRPSPEILSRVDTVVHGAASEDTTAAIGPLFLHSDRVHFWSAAAARMNGRTIGYIAQLRTIRSNADNARTLNNLIGSESRILFANTHGGAPWVTLDGTVVRPPEKVVGNGDYEQYYRDGKWFIAGRDTVDGTALAVVIETMINPGRFGWRELAERMSIVPAHIARLPEQGRPLTVGEPGNVTLIDNQQHPRRRDVIHRGGDHGTSPDGRTTFAEGLGNLRRPRKRRGPGAAQQQR